MLRVIIGLILILFGAQAFLRRSPPPGTGVAPAGRFSGLGNLLRGPLVGILMVIAGLGFLASTSFVQISADRVGHLKRIYLADDLPPGRITGHLRRDAMRTRAIPRSLVLFIGALLALLAVATDTQARFLFF